MTRLRKYHWAAFDEFVQRIGFDRWLHPDATNRKLKVYEALRGAGLLKAQSGFIQGFLGLTATGRREVCQRAGHHAFDTDRPAPDGCGVCSATICHGCSGFGTVSRQRGPAPTLLELSCRDCGGLGLRV